MFIEMKLMTATHFLTLHVVGFL